MILRKLADLVGILWDFALSVQDSSLAKDNKVLYKYGMDFTSELCHLFAVVRSIDRKIDEKSRNWRPLRFYDLKGGYVEDSSPNPYKIIVNMKTQRPTKVFKELNRLFNRWGINERDCSVLYKSEKKFRELLALRQQCELAHRIYDDEFKETPVAKKAVERETEYPSSSFNDRKYAIARLDWSDESRKFRRACKCKRYGAQKTMGKGHDRKRGRAAKEALAAWNV